jgi:hypothetical protein
MKWIDIKKELPHHNTYCLVYDGKYITIAYYYTVHHDHAPEGGEGGWSQVGDHASVKVTHWIYLTDLKKP